MRLIDADELVKKERLYYSYLADEFYVRKSDIENAPTIEERKKGKWIGKPIAGYCTVRCSVCKDVFRENNGRWNFCPDCGADMRGKKNDAEIY